MSIVLGCPRDCYDTCRLGVYVEGGRISRVVAENDRYTKGVLCPRAAKDVERVYSPLRILYPSINIGGGVFKKIDWGYAIDLLVSRLREVLERYGPKYVLLLEYAGNRGILTRHASRRLWNYLAATQTDRSICNYSGARALKLVYGSTYGVFPDDIEQLNMAIIWGFNPAVSAIHLWRRILGIKERGGQIVTVDVRVTETARQSGSFIKVRPGSDGYLALGIARYLLEHNYIDREFIERYTYGFNELAKHLDKYGLDTVERATGVPRNRIAEFAEMMVHGKPFAIFIGYGLQRRYGGGDIVRSISILPALLGIHRGFYYSNTDGLPLNLAAVEGLDLWPSRNTISMEKVGEELCKGVYKFVYIHLHNPVATLPNANKVAEGLRKKDVFVVVHETHWSDTAKIADMVLPAPTFYEKLDLVYSYLHNMVYLNRPVIDPLGESIGEYQLMCEIVKHIIPDSYVELCPDPYKLFEIAIGKENFERLLNVGFIELKTRPRDEYQTPTRRIELYSTAAEREGLPPLPVPSAGDYCNEGELVLITSAHPLYIHTQFEEIYGSKQSCIYISLEDAKRFKLSSGDLVKVWSRRGTAIMVANIDSNISRGIAWTSRQAHTADGRRINVLLDDGVDSYGGAVLNSTCIKIQKIATTDTMEIPTS
ncbi:MAG: molybdopterin-dependent oxidoreductase [Ignisphaera sp.]